MTFRQFEAELDEEVAQFRDAIGETRDRIVFEGFSRVVELTPVDTGFARNSWFVEAGDGATRQSNNGSGQPTPSDVLPTTPAFQPVTIANGAEYINQLEEGRSDQAPNGMVSVTLAELRSKFRRVR